MGGGIGLHWEAVDEDMSVASLLQPEKFTRTSDSRVSDRVFLDANILVSAAWRPDNGLLALWTLTDVTRLTSAYATPGLPWPGKRFTASRDLITSEVAALRPEALKRVVDVP
jgi:hypothetical protein